MKKIILLLSLLATTTSMAVDFSIVNNTGGQMRIDQLFNKCDGALISSDQPVVLEAGQSYDLKNITPVMHHYKICGLGYCSSTAFGIKEEIHYVLSVVLEDGFLINGIAMPDHWIGNTECPAKP